MDHIKSYVLRAGRISAAQRRSYETLFPRYGLALGPALALPRVFGNDHPVIAEIGFGMGSATVLMAEENPGINYLGIEVHRPGIGRLLWEIERRRVSNIRVIEHDAVEALERMIPDASLDGLHIFFPDPWPKKRHRKRRLLARPVTDLLAQKLRPGAYLYTVTDWEDYAQSALRELAQTPLLQNAYPGFAQTQSWRPRTKFEQRGIAEARPIRELFFIRGGSSPAGHTPASP
ncbi:MAG: tRNA (guanosine(46)-N7)-methyltransferase TrmB [Treponema sp.]|jgi:tRNA (guanine-N7-)-methyltransferase|nr:tRNA (guanosine(46)-N7)-methyltransferase TrmB [Treponema sp.]